MTPKRFRVLAFIARYSAEHGYSPSYEEIRIEIGVRSLASVHDYVDTLDARGLILRSPGQRALEVTERGRTLLATHKPCPICGNSESKA